MVQTLRIVTNDNSEALLRVVGVIIRRYLAIESLSYEKNAEGMCEIMVTISGEESRLSRIAYQVEKIIDVSSVRSIE